MPLSSVIREAIRCFLPTERKPHRIRRGPLRGRLIYTSWHDYPGAIRGDTEGPLLDWFARQVLAGETWLDIGAHYGYTAMALANLVGTSGRVFAFEPVAETASCIGRTKDLNQLDPIRVVPLGLSTEQSVQRIPVYRGMADKTVNKSTELIKVAAFDGVWGSLCEGKPEVHGVKIDVQGMEREVLAGMTGMLQASHPKLIVEFHSGVDRTAVLDLISACGYSRKPESVEPGSGELMDNKSYIFRSILD